MKQANSAITMASRAIWLALRNDGGWWTAGALTRLWEPTFSQDEMVAILQGLEKGRFVARRDPGERIPSFAVTAQCAALPGTSAPVAERLAA